MGRSAHNHGAARFVVRPQQRGPIGVDQRLSLEVLERVTLIDFDDT